MSSHNIVKVADIMTDKLITLNAEDNLEKATQLFEKYNYDGFPVVNEEGILLGIVTAYDMVSQSYATHLPSLLHILDHALPDDNSGQAIRERFDILRFFDENYFYKMLEDSGHQGILKRLERFGDK